MIDSGDEEHDEDESKRATDSMDDILSEFRAQWQKELKISSDNTNKSQTVTTSNDNDPENEMSIENRAKQLFMKGIEHEQSGKLYEAVCFYKKAVTLVPDIEFRLYEQTKAKEKAESNEITDSLDYNSSQRENNEDNNASSESDDEELDLFLKLSRIVNSNQTVCFPQYEQNATHISALPLEIVLYILRWVVSTELDLRSLEMFAKVCRGFYVSARDPEIWRLACIRAWGINCGHYEPNYDSWRHMYLTRTRLRYNGCYISRTTYLRHGESAYQDAFYKPWYLVEYFRYLRFFPEGKVLMLTSTEEAQACVNYLKSRNPLNPSILIGHYRLHDRHVNLYLKKQEVKSNNNDYKRKRRGDCIHDSGEQTYHIEFEIQNHHKKINSQLHWIKYNIYTKYKNGEQTTTCLTLGVRYPPFKFSRVKSYTRESEAPLQ